MVYSSLKRHLQCGGLFLKTLNKPVHALSWAIRLPSSLVPLLVGRLRFVVDKGWQGEEGLPWSVCSLSLSRSLHSFVLVGVSFSWFLALGCSRTDGEPTHALLCLFVHGVHLTAMVSSAYPTTPTLGPDDTYELPSVHPDHARAVVEGCLLLRTLTTLFHRAQEALPGADGGYVTEDNPAALAFQGVATLVRTLTFLLESAMPRGSQGLPGPGGFSIVRAAGAAMAAVQSSQANAKAFVAAGGVTLSAALLSFVRAIEVPLKPASADLVSWWHVSVVASVF